MPTLLNGTVPLVPLADLPADLPTEAALLTILLADRDAIIHVADRLRPGHFMDPRHAALYQAIAALYAARRPPDLVTVEAWLTDHALLEQAGGPAYVGEVVFQGYRPCVPVHVTHYADILLTHAARRRRLAVAEALGALAYRRDLDPEAEAAEQARILAGLWADAPATGAGLATVLSDLLTDLSARQQSGARPGVPTGLPSLDRLIYGWEPGTTNLIGALTSIGKTALALHFARTAALHASTPVVILSLEMDNAQIARRLLAAESRVDLGTLRTAALSEADWGRLSDASARLTSGAPITLLDSGVQTVAALLTEVQRAQADPARGCGLLIVDYLQLMDGSAKGATREQDVASVSRGLKRLARQCSVPVLVLSQLNDGAEGTDPPQLRDFRESRAPAMDASVVGALYRPDPVNAPNRRAFCILKHRDGEANVILPLDWDGPRQRWTEARA